MLSPSKSMGTRIGCRRSAWVKLVSTRKWGNGRASNRDRGVVKLHFYLPVIIACMIRSPDIVPGISGNLAESLDDAHRRIEVILRYSCGPFHGYADDARRRGGVSRRAPGHKTPSVGSRSAASTSRIGRRRSALHVSTGDGRPEVCDTRERGARRVCGMSGAKQERRVFGLAFASREARRRVGKLGDGTRPGTARDP